EPARIEACSISSSSGEAAATTGCGISRTRSDEDTIASKPVTLTGCGHGSSLRSGTCPVYTALSVSFAGWFSEETSAFRLARSFEKGVAVTDSDSRKQCFSRGGFWRQILAYRTRHKLPNLHLVHYPSHYGSTG